MWGGDKGVEYLSTGAGRCRPTAVPTAVTHVRRIVAAEGGDVVVTSYHRRLVELSELRPDLIEVRSVTACG